MKYPAEMIDLCNCGPESVRLPYVVQTSEPISRLGDLIAALTAMRAVLDDMDVETAGCGDLRLRLWRNADDTHTLEVSES